MTRGILLLLLFFASFTAASEAQCLPRQRDALLRLKTGFIFFSGTGLSTWTISTDCCHRWDGVTCDPRSGEVTALNLSGRSISGEVDPDGLSNLTALTSLNLAFNNLTFDAVLSSRVFGALRSLRELNLSFSGFAGQIPLEISNLTGLISLDFSNLYLPANVSLKNPNLRELTRNLRRLEVLYLDGVQISSDGGDWSAALSESVPRLTQLSLVDCGLAGPIAASFAKLKFLTRLHLDQNNLSSGVSGLFLGNLSSLQVLRLRYCGLTGSMPETISSLKNLTVLDMSNNPLLGGHLPESIGSLLSVEMLLLSNCMISGSIPASIAKLGKLSKLDLSNNNLTGVLPGFNVDLGTRSISEIVLRNNRLTGDIPSSYGKLEKLTVLDLQNNSLAGQVPLSLFTLPSLKTLDLHLNNLSGGLQSLTHASAPLETLDLSSNKLQGAIPDTVFKLSSIKILTLASNNFNGTVDLNLLPGLRNLSSLDLSYNRLKVVGSEGYSSSFPNISTLKLASCGITKFPAFLQVQSRVIYLDMSVNRLAGVVPSWLWKIGGNPSSLSHLNLSYNLLTGFEPPLPNPVHSFIKVIDLHHNMLDGPIPLPPGSNSVVDYSNNRFSSIIPANISLYLNFTIFFSVSNNSLTGNLPPHICGAPYLQVLDLSLNNLSGSISDCLFRASNLRVLNLRGNTFDGRMVTNFSNGCSLRTLNLNSNHLQGEITEPLSNCKMLEVLDLGRNCLDGPFPSWLGSLTELRVLILRSNNFTGPVEVMGSSNGSFDNLQIIDLSSNNFNGTLSSGNFVSLKAMTLLDEKASQPVVQFKYLQGFYYQDMVMVTSKGLQMTLVKILTIYTSIDLSNNRFEGHIPDEIGRLNALVALNMSRNNFSGLIPGSIGNLTRLESLDLSINNLSGSIPSALTTLNFLSFLNLSFNSLSGVIPMDGQFGTFSSASFMGNPGLCGFPLPNCPPLENSGYSRAATDHEVIHNWLFIFVGLGLGGGLALGIGPLLLFEKWRGLFNYYIDMILLATFPSCFWDWVSCGDGRVGADDKLVEELDWVDEGPAYPFCIFCTELDLSSGQALIYHRECSCTTDHK